MAGEDTGSVGSAAPPNQGTGSNSQPASPSPSSSPAPSGAPSSIQPLGGADAAPDSGATIDFDMLFSGGGDQPPLSQPQPPQTPTEPAQQPPPAEPVREAPPPGQLPPETAGVAQQGAPAQQAAPVQVDPTDPLSLAEYLRANEAIAVDSLAKTVFKLEQKDLEALETDISTTIPVLLSRVAVFAQQQALTQMGRLLPEMMMRFGEMVQKHSSNERMFYQAWPSIDRARYGKQVTELGIRFRQMFPNATLDQMIDQLGPLAMSQLGLPLVPRVRTGQPSPVAAPGMGNGRAAPPPRGFVPAAPGGVSQIPQSDSDPWSWMGQRE